MLHYKSGIKFTVEEWSAIYNALLHSNWELHMSEELLDKVGRMVIK